MPGTVVKSLDQKLARIHADPARCTDFILADAKDADMATGLAATGIDAATGKQRSLAEYRDQMRQVTRQGLVDIMLMSCSTMDQLAIQEKLFADSSITPACRANDTTDIHLPTGGTYAAEPSRPFRTATIEQMQSGKIDPSPGDRKLGADLGLYSITPNNKLEFDYVTLNAYKDFRNEAEAKGFRHFLEVFDPNVCGQHCPADLGRYINDLIVRTLAGVPRAGRPVFLKIVYHGPRAMEELAAYDPHLIPGILGGSSGTTFDAFKLLADAKKYGARAGLFGRKINNSEHQLSFVTYLRAIADSRIEPAEAVRAYHGDLEKFKLKPYRPLKEDLQETTQASSYSGTSTTTISTPAIGKSTTPGPATTSATSPSTTAANSKPNPPAAEPAPVKTPAVKTVSNPSTAPTYPMLANGQPDYKKMTAAQKVALSRDRIRQGHS